MDSTIFNRRTLLGSGALAGLGALLAACGQQANNEAAPHPLRRASRLRLLRRLLNRPLRAPPHLLSEDTLDNPKPPTESTVKPTAMGRPRTSLNLMPLKRATARSLLKVSVRRWMLGLNGLIMEFR